MKKQQLIETLKKIPNSQYIQITFDMGAVEGKLFKDKKFGTLLLFADGFESLTLDFSSYEDEVPWVEGILVWRNGQWDQPF